MKVHVPYQYSLDWILWQGHKIFSKFCIMSLEPCIQVIAMLEGKCNTSRIRFVKHHCVIGEKVPHKQTKTFLQNGSDNKEKSLLLCSSHNFLSSLGLFSGHFLCKNAPSPLKPTTMHQPVHTTHVNFFAVKINHTLFFMHGYLITCTMYKNAMLCTIILSTTVTDIDYCSTVVET